MSRVSPFEEVSPVVASVIRILKDTENKSIADTFTNVMVILVNVVNPPKNPKLKALQSTFLPKAKKDFIEIVKQIKLKPEIPGGTCDYKGTDRELRILHIATEKLINRILHAIKDKDILTEDGEKIFGQLQNMISTEFAGVTAKNLISQIDAMINDQRQRIKDDKRIEEDKQLKIPPTNKFHNELVEGFAAFYCVVVLQDKAWSLKNFPNFDKMDKSLKILVNLISSDKSEDTVKSQACIALITKLIMNVEDEVYTGWVEQYTIEGSAARVFITKVLIGIHNDIVKIKLFLEDLKSAIRAECLAESKSIDSISSAKFIRKRAQEIFTKLPLEMQSNTAKIGEDIATAFKAHVNHDTGALISGLQRLSVIGEGAISHKRTDLYKFDINNDQSILQFGEDAAKKLRELREQRYKDIKAGNFPKQRIHVRTKLDHEGERIIIEEKKYDSLEDQLVDIVDFAAGYLRRLKLAELFQNEFKNSSAFFAQENSERIERIEREAIAEIIREGLGNKVINLQAAIFLCNHFGVEVVDVMVPGTSFSF